MKTTLHGGSMKSECVHIWLYSFCTPLPPCNENARSPTPPGTEQGASRKYRYNIFVFSRIQCRSSSTQSYYVRRYYYNRVLKNLLFNYKFYKLKFDFYIKLMTGHEVMIIFFFTNITKAWLWYDMRPYISISCRIFLMHFV